MATAIKSTFLFLVLFSAKAFSQSEKGQIINNRDKTPVAYAKIGVPNKGIGTVADENGVFVLPGSKLAPDDTIRISCIGFQPYNILVSDFKHVGNKQLEIAEKPPVEPAKHVLPAQAVVKTFGNTDAGHGFISVNGGLPGSEAGITVNFKNQALLQTLKIGIDSCTLDSIFFRVNVYKVSGNNKFQNILTKPVYFKTAVNAIEGKSIVIDLSAEEIWVKGQYLICIEQVKTFNNGLLRFTGKSPGKSFVRKTSFATWRTAPATLSMVIEAKTI